MLSQGIWWSGQSFLNHTVTYNMTLAPDYRDSEKAVENFKMILAQKYGLSANNVDVSPTDIGKMQFLVRSKLGADDRMDPTPVATPSASPAASPAVVAANTVFTEYIVPSWTGDFHNIGSLFSIIIRGRTWDLEPTLQRMFLHESDNAVVGQISFSFPVQSLVFDAHIVCDIHQFQSTFRSTLKSWAMTHSWGRGYDYSTFSNDERNAVRASLNIESFCDVQQFVDTTHFPKSTLDARKEQLFDLMFNKAFKAVTDSGLPPDQGGKDAKYTYLEQIAEMDAHGHIDLSFKDTQVFNLSSDLDFYAGHIPEDNLDYAHKYLCAHFERFDNKEDRCVIVCDPQTQIYLRGNPHADEKGCVNLTDHPIATEKFKLDNQMIRNRRK